MGALDISKKGNRLQNKGGNETQVPVVKRAATVTSTFL